MLIKMNEIDKYIEQFPPDVQEAMLKIRGIILKEVPEAEERLGYGIPGYYLNKKPLVYFAGYKSHIGFYATPNGHEQFADELSVYKQGKGSVQFPLGPEIPFDLILKIVKFRRDQVLNPVFNLIFKSNMTNKIFPCLWFNGNGREAAGFYTETFNGRITADTPVVVNMELFGQKMMILDAGPQFEKNASVSFMVLCETEEEVTRYWEPLAEGGIVLLELGEYPWSKKYGWVRDRYGVTWQVYLGEKQGDQKIVPTLMFIHQNNGKAIEALEFYTGIFPDSRIGDVLKYGEGIGNETHEVPHHVQHAHFELDGYSFFCMDSSYDHKFDFSEGISLVVMTDDQQETDHLWSNLTADGGRESMCGWLKDKFGLSWQIVPKRLLELMNGSDREKGQKVAEAMMQMQKIVIADLEAAYNS